MPELPEVETVKEGLKQALGAEPVIETVRFLSPALRRPLPFEKSNLVEKQPILSVKRRAKYLLFELPGSVILSHLGMTGSWRLESSPSRPENPRPRARAPKAGRAQGRNHDHVELHLADGRVLIYRDPRRFGQFDVLPADFQIDSRFCHLGPEPLDESTFSGDYVLAKTRDRKVPIKALLMDQGFVVGVGNIYASEALFFAGLNPAMPARELQRGDADRLVTAVREVLQDAIAFGGTTISDFRQAGGASGYFQNILLVYGEEGEPCAVCATPIASRVIGGRSTYWCPKCQSL